MSQCASFNFLDKKGTMCNLCVKSCPWSNPPTWQPNLVRDIVMRATLGQRVAIRAAKAMRTGNQHPVDQWGFDMEYVDNVIEDRT